MLSFLLPNCKKPDLCHDFCYNNREEYKKGEENMAKGKSTVFFCQECGYESSKWAGQCPSCKAWNTFVEEPVVKKANGKTVAKSLTELKPLTIDEIETKDNDRFNTGIQELDRVLGGGIVPGSLVLVGGDPGIGKSTLLLQVCKELSDKKYDVLYISGEESLRQIKMRAQRIGQFNSNLKLLCETDLDSIETIIATQTPDVVVIDSIQTMSSENVTSAPGSVSQVREATSILMKVAKQHGVATFIVGHVTKEGTVAGPRVLEHMVDTVLYFEGDRHASYRILRGVKNRFGSTNEIGVFEMRDTGLQEVPNPSEYLLTGRPEGASGSVVTCAMEGTRPVLLEVQALVCKTSFANPKRAAAGVDYNRMNLLMAVLEKKINIPMSVYDAYVNITGGIRMSEPALDLGIILAIVSSAKDKEVPSDTIVFGEVGLSGEIRAVSMAKQRVMEAKKLGFKKVILPSVCLENIGKISGIDLIGVSNLSEAIKNIC